MDRLVLRLLGEFEARLSGRGHVALRLAKSRAVLAYLALAESQFVSRGRLCALLWPRVGESHARQSLRQVVADVRRALGPASSLLVSRSESLGLERGHLTCDVAIFERHTKARRWSALVRAARLYRGSFLGSLDLVEPEFVDWQTGELRRLDALARTVLAQLYDLAERGPLNVPLALASQLVRSDPYDESVHRALMILYARSGAKREALRQFEICRRHLRHGLDQAPSPETVAVYEDIRRGDSTYGPIQNNAESNSIDSASMLVRRIRILVLPFVSGAPDPATKLLARAATAELVKSLQRMRDLEVVAPCASSGRPVSQAGIARTHRGFGEHYRVEGRIDVAARRIRLDVVLIDTKAKSEVWRHEYVGEDNAPGGLLLEVMERIAGALANRATSAASPGIQSRDTQFEARIHRYGLGDDKTAGINYLVEAGDWARRLYANEDAVRHYRRALAAVGTDKVTRPEHLAVLERLADLLSTMGQRDEALSHYQTLIDACTSNADTVGQARSQRKTALLHWEVGARDIAKSALNRAFDLLQNDEYSIERGYLCHEMGRLAFRSGDNDQALSWAERAIAAAVPFFEDNVKTVNSNGSDLKASAASVVAEANNTIGATQARLGQTAEAIGHVERSLEIAQAHDLHLATCRACANLSVLYGNSDPRRAIEISQLGLEIANRIGHLGYQSNLYTTLGVAFCTFHVRCDKDGVDAMNRSIELDRRLNLIDHLPMPLIALGQIHQCHGQPRRAIGYYREALPLAEKLAEPQILFPCYDGLATSLLETDDLDGARTYMNKAQGVCERAGLDPHSLLVLPFLC